MEDKGFCMFIRAKDKFKDYYQTLVSRLDFKDTVLIYSMWKEYINDRGKHAIQFISMFPNMEKLQTRGHASPEFLAEVCNFVNPSLGIILIHSENSANYSKLPIEKHLQQKILTSSKTIDKVEIKINQSI